ncbi:heparin lyase I family protein [Bradyrhizobium sp. STM 3557]|uniref:heparin lyase I family protein n=1 Tax=Bradyrhizobium sp. STM 3557 TaxID=578920 RepID=UPI00388DB7AB
MAKTPSPVILAVSPDDLALDNDGSTSYSDELTLVGTAVPYSSIVIYDGSTQIGTATANSSGVWTFQTKPLTDSSHSFTATATAAGSTTSSASAAVTLTVASDISNFSPLTDQWSAPIYVGGQPYYVENANVNGNAPWAITQLDSHTLQFQLRPNDIWADNDSHRSEISGGTVFAATKTISVSYQFEVLPGFSDTSGNLAWLILGQFHGDDNNTTYQNIQGGSPPLAFHLAGANGQGQGDYLAIEGFYALTGQNSWTVATPTGDPYNGYLYVSPTPIVRGQYYDIQIEVSFQNNSNGFVEIWINGTQVVDYHGPIGYGGGMYWKEGVYEGWSSNQTITVNYANTTVTAAPGAPLILGNTVNGNQVMLSGTAQANSTVTVYDGSIKLGTVTVASNGAWFYETGALATGSHTLTATATDGSGTVGAASSAAAATISTFTGPIIKNVAISAASGEALVGQTITFTLTMSSAVTVTGTPTLSLNDGGTAVYKSGSGSSTLTFTYVVGASDTTLRGLAITGMTLPSGAAITDSSGNGAILTGAAVQFPGVTIDTQAVKTPVFGDPVANSDGTFTFTGTAGANTTVYFMTSYGSPLGSAAVDSTGHWTFTSPSFEYGTWNSIQAYNVNSLGDVSAIGTENGSGFGATVKVPASPTITGNALTGNAVTLYGTVGSGVTKVTVYDGTTALGTATVNSDNTWSFTTGALSGGAHKLSATATNSSGTSGKSAVDTLLIGGASVGVSSIVASGTGITSGSGDLGAASVVTLTVNMSGNVTVAGGPPTLTLNDGGTATYVGGSGTSTLTFSYTVAAGQNTSDLAVTAFTLNGGTLTDASGNAADLSGVVSNPSGTLQIDTTLPTVASVVASGTGITSGSGNLTTGNVVTLTVNISEAVTVTGGTPTLTLNDGGTATYTGGSGTSALTFSYTVGAGQSTSDLAVTAVNLNGATVADGAGNAANLAGAVTNPSGTLQVNAKVLPVSSIVASGTGITSGNGDLGAGSVVTLTVNLSDVVTVAGGTPTLTLNDGGTATYTGGSGTSALTFSYTVAAGQNTSDLSVTAFNLNGATVKDSTGTSATLTGAVTNPSGTLQIDTTSPTVSSVAASGTGITSGNGDLGAGSVVTLTVNLSEAVTVAGGTPTLTLNNGGTATYTGGSGTSALTFSYTVAAGQNTSDLTVTALSLNGATVTDGAGNSATLTGAVANPSGTLQIDTTAPTVSSVAASGTGITSGSGNLGAGSVVTLTVNLSEAVTVAGGTPTLTLNDGGTATYTGGSGTSTLTFSYTVSAGQSTSDLAVTAISLNGATVKDGAGNSATLSGAVTNPSGTLQIDGTAPTVSSVVTSGTGITSGRGDLGAGSVVTLTVNLSEAVTVAGGTPTLSLNNGGTATYSGGSGTNALTFSYKVAAGQNTSDLTVTAVSLNGATVKDGAGNSAILTGAVTNPSGTLQIDTTTPTVSSVVASGTGVASGSGDLGAGSVVTLTVNLSEAVTVAGGTPTLTLNDGGTATYAGGSGTNALTFSYTVAAGQNTADLTVTAVNLNGATVKDGAGNSAALTGAITNPSGTLQIDGTAPTISSVAASGTGITGSAGSVAAGSVVTLTVKLSEAVTVAGGTPTLTLNDGGTAIYVGGSGTNALTFSYTVAASDSDVSALAISQLNLPSGTTIKDSAGNNANLTGIAVTFSSLSVDQPSTIEAAGTTDLVQAAHTYYLDPSNGGTGPQLKFGGAVLTVGQLGSNWTILGAEAVGGGYDVVWKNTSTGLYNVWSVDGSGSYVKDLVSGASATSGVLESFESVLQQDLNGDGTVGLVGTPIDAAGSTSLLRVGSNYFLTPVGGTSGVELIFDKSALTVGQFGSSWTVLGAEAVSGGYEVVWKNTSTGLYNVWSVDSSGNYVKDLVSGASAASGVLESFETVFQQDLNGDGTIGVYTRALESSGATKLTQVADTYYLNPSSGGTGPQLKFGGAVLTVGQLGSNWTILGAEAVGGGYDVVWKNTSTGLYNVWSVDGSGSYVKDLVSGASATSGVLESFESVLQQDLNGDGTVGLVGTPIDAAGSTSLLRVGSNYFLTPVGGTSGVELIFDKSALTVGQFGSSWTVLGAEAVSGGYEVVWKNTSTGLYNVWSVDSSGNYVKDLVSGASATSGVLESFETVFQQDLNGDGTIGVYTRALESSGATKLTQVADTYYLNPSSGGTGPQLKFGGAVLTVGQLGSNWTILGAEAVSGGYDVVWKNTSTGLYNVWSVDGSGNYVKDLVSGASATSGVLESFETVFQQDLNGDGTIGVYTGALESSGATKLTQVADTYYLNPSSGGTGPQLKFGGAVLAVGQLGSSWTILGAEAVSGGYDVVWKNTTTGLYNVWSVDSSGNYVKDLVSGVSADSNALKTYELLFQQDLNGDGIITIPNGQTMELTGSFSGEIMFGGATGTLIIDHSDQFHGTIGGQLTTTDVIDFKDITAGSNASLAYSGNNSPGTLTVSDGTHTAQVALLGSYSLANFTASSDGHGGTSVVDPPIASAQVSSLDQQIALFSQYMASDFASTSSNTEHGSLLGLDQLSSLAHLAVIPPQQHANV